MKNFMTYDQVELFPGPNLNMILGPNGTGKSAIVCCVIVGLAGDVSLTGRGASAADFVNKYKDFAVTEIELYNPNGQNYVINRRISITSRTQHKIEIKSEWKINGKTCIKSEVTTLIKNLNVKVDNLCQFLPQDSVTQFVKMNSFELLHNTLKAAGDSKLVDDHNRLVELTERIKTDNAALDGLIKLSKEHEVNARRLHAEVELIQQKKQLTEERKICTQKLYYIRYVEAESNHAKALRDSERVVKELKTVEDSCEPFRVAREDYKQKYETINEAVKKSEDSLREISTKIEAAKSKIENLKIGCQEKFAKFKAMQDQENQRESTMRLKQQELDSYECRMNEIRDVDHSRQIKQAEADIERLKESRRTTQREKSNAEDIINQCHHELEELANEEKQIRSVKDKKINLLKVKFQDTFRVLEWLSKNKQLFKERIFAPIMCELNVKDPKYNRIIEHAIPRTDLSAFVCQTAEDLKTFTRSVRDALGIRFNVVLVPQSASQRHQDDAPNISTLSHLGVKAYLVDLIDAPEPIIQYLSRTHNFHRIPVVDDCSEQQLKQLLNMMPRFYVGNTFYQITRSRYDSQQMTVSDSVRDAQLILYSLDTTRLAQNSLRFNDAQKRRSAAQNQRDELLKKDDDLKREWQVVKERFQDLKVKHDEKKRLATLVQLARDSIEKLKCEKVDLNVERSKLQEAINFINSKMVKQLDDLVKVYRQMVDLKMMHMKNLVLLRLSIKNNRLADLKYRAAQKDTSRLKEELNKMRTSIRALQKILDDTIVKTNEKVPGFKDGRLTKATADKFAKIAENTVSELSDKRENLAMRIERIYTDSNNSILSEYEKQNKELQEKQYRMNELEEQLAKLRSECNSIKEGWLIALNDVIKVIDDSYRDFMRKLGYDGQVKLDFNSADTDNFSAYGIMIMVKYRDDEQLIPLSSTRQSGGERSVATMIYMLALQTKTTVPFRCVDEINQGMDKTNERRVFELLVQTADSSSSQYFLVSPKLLPDLSYTDKMRIHIIFNGRGLDKRIKI